jgi:hypothetical protein
LGLARWPTLAALVVLLGGLALAVQQWRVPARSQPAPPPAESEAPATPVEGADEIAIEQALRLTPGLGESENKTGWMDEVKGVDLTPLSPRLRERFLVHANAQRCTCGCGYTLARCRTYDPTCEVSLPRVRALFDSVRSGLVAGVTGLRPRPVSSMVVDTDRR